jgi:hypothetical protein
MMNKKQITIQIDPLLISQVHQYAKDQGIAKQIGYDNLLRLGFDTLTELSKSKIQLRMMNGTTIYCIAGYKFLTLTEAILHQFKNGVYNGEILKNP